MGEPRDEASADPTTDLLEPLDTRPGTTIAGRFRVESLLGSGGYGEVWLARQLRVDRLVALKLLRADMAHREDAARRFEREARLASRLSHPNAVRVIDFGDDRGTLFLAMDHVVGPTLRERLRERGALPWRDAAWLALRIAAALRAAHGLGLVHRDLKPANVLVTRIDGVEQPVVIDFGLAKIFDSDVPDDNITRAHVMLGTPAYMCPEVVRGAAIDGRADLYSLGVLLFELLTGRVPLRGASPVETATMHLHVAPPDLAQLVPDAPPQLAALVAGLLSKSPADRPADAALVMDALAEVLADAPATLPASATTQLADAEHEQVTLPPTRRPAPAAEPAVRTVAPVGTTPVEPSPRPTRTAWFVVAAVVVAACLAAVLAAAGASRRAGPAAVSTSDATGELTGTATNAYELADAVRSGAAAASMDAAPGGNDGSGRGMGAGTEPGGASDGSGAGRLGAALSLVRAPNAAGPGADTGGAGARTGGSGTATRSQRAEEVRLGRVEVRVDPAGRVELEGFPAREAPATFRSVPVGRHTLRIVNGDAEHSEQIVVRDGETLVVRHRFVTDDAPSRTPEGSQD